MAVCILFEGRASDLNGRRTVMRPSSAKRSLYCGVSHVDDFLSISASLEESLLLPRNEQGLDPLQLETIDISSHAHETTLQ